MPSAAPTPPADTDSTASGTNADSADQTPPQPVAALPDHGQDREEGDADTDADADADADVASSIEPGGKAACFPAEATVQLESGTRVRMDQLRVGDQVLVAGGRFSPVFMFTHRTAARAAGGGYTQLRTAGGLSLTATDGHYVQTAGRGLVAAGAVRVGDALVRGGADAAADAVVAAGPARARGLYNPHTLDGTLVVDGVVASAYTTALAPGAAHVALAPLRVAYRAAGLWTSVMESGLPAHREVVDAIEAASVVGVF